MLVCYKENTNFRSFHKKITSATVGFSQPCSVFTKQTADIHSSGGHKKCIAKGGRGGGLFLCVINVVYCCKEARGGVCSGLFIETEKHILTIWSFKETMSRDCCTLYVTF